MSVDITITLAFRFVSLHFHYEKADDQYMDDHLQNR